MPGIQRVRVDYLLVIEWLRGGESRTGERLYGAIRTEGVPAKLVQCRSKTEVLSAIENATWRFLEGRGLPAIQIETHGCLDGLTSNDRDEFLSWEELASPLRALNLLSRFNLVLIGAACYGLASCKTFNVESVAPFAIALGFSGKVQASNVYWAMREFHRTLFSGSRNLKDAISSANRELFASKGESLQATSCEQMGTMLLEHFVAQDVDLNYRAQRVEKVRRAMISNGIDRTLDEIDSVFVEHGPKIVKAIVAKWLAYDSITENQARFAIDVDAIYDKARKTKG